MTCAIPPLDQSEVRIGRGYGIGYNSARTVRDQLHAGMDFVASGGAPVLAPLPGVVDFLTFDDGPRISADQARGGARGQVRQMGGYGNAVVLRHDVAVPGLPNPFFTSYNHMRGHGPGLAPGVAVATGQLLGTVGGTTNRQFPGMGAHLHMELRRVPFPGSYERDTLDPNLMWSGLGIDWIGGRTEIERRVGGQLLIRADGPSGPAVCPRTTAGLAAFGYSRTRVERVKPHDLPFYLSGIDAYMSELPGFTFGSVPAGYVDPVRLKTSYSSKGTTQAPREGSPAADVMPPDYAPSGSPVATAAGAAASAGAAAVGNSAIWIGGGIAAAIVIAGMMKGR